MKPRDYEYVWKTLKVILLTQYNVRSRLAKGKNLEQLERILKNMDHLDGTHDFSNLLHDLERGGK